MGTKLLRDSTTVLIHGFSRCVLAVLYEAAKAGRNFSVVVTEGRPDAQGLAAAQALRQVGVRGRGPARGPACRQLLAPRPHPHYRAPPVPPIHTRAQSLVPIPSMRLLTGRRVARRFRRACQ